MLYCSSLVRTRLGSLDMAVGGDYSVSGEKKWQSILPKRVRTKEEQYSMYPDKGTTKPGYINPRDQEVIRNTRKAGAGRGHWIYELKCRACGHHYGANGNYIHSRKCPKCQGGQPGPSL